MEAKFTLVYAGGGGFTMDHVDRMRKKDFLFYLNRLVEQKKSENAALEKSRKGTTTTQAPSGRMKYLGR